MIWQCEFQEHSDRPRLRHSVSGSQAVVTCELSYLLHLEHTHGAQLQLNAAELSSNTDTQPEVAEQNTVPSTWTASYTQVWHTLFSVLFKAKLIVAPLRVGAFVARADIWRVTTHNSYRCSATGSLGCVKHIG